MKYYEITGYIIPKGQEEKGWQKIRDGVKIQLPDEVNPYDAINQSFKTEASKWMFVADEITREEMNNK